MIGHPLLMAVLLLDLLALLFAGYAALPYGRVLIAWSPEIPTRRQVALEASTEGASLAARVAVCAFLASSLLWVASLTLVLPALVPGAMCGTGVLQAMEGQGWRAMGLRGFALALLWVWCTLDGVNRAQPQPHPSVAPGVARWHLLALPFLTLAGLQTLRAIRQLNPHQPVDCCQVVYNAFRSVDDATHTAGLPDVAWLWGCAVGAAALVGIIVWAWVRPEAARSAHGALLVASLLWLPVAAVTLVRVLSAYHYEVLHHHCPWCLFLPEHGAVGYPLFGALLITGLESLAAFTAATGLKEGGTCEEVARARQRRARVVILVAVFVFVALAGGPMVLWRLRYGVWMHG